MTDGVDTRHKNLLRRIFHFSYGAAKQHDDLSSITGWMNSLGSEKYRKSPMIKSRLIRAE